MAVSARQVKNKRDGNGELTGRAGTVYDVNIKYITHEGKKSYAKKGFSTKKEALVHEAEMHMNLTRPGYVPVPAVQAKRMLGDYLLEWLENYGKNNLRINTYNGYRVNINKHIIPAIGNIAMQDITAASLDKFYNKLLGSGLSASTVKYAHRTISIALEHARKYRYLTENPARSILTRFQGNVKTPDPYTIKQVSTLMDGVKDTDWETIISLGGLYGLRRNEIIGLRWENVHLSERWFSVEEQLSSKASKEHVELAPVKQRSSNRILPITDLAQDVLIRHKSRQEKQKEVAGENYHDNDLVACKENGDPIAQTHVSHAFNNLLEKFNLPHIRFHDLRHTAATNMHELTGDFFTVGEILGHSLKGVGMQLGMAGKLDAATTQYVNVRLERKATVLDTYHKAVKKRREIER